MGGSSGGSSSGGGGGGGGNDDKPAKKKKATPKAKVYASPNEQGQKKAPKAKAKAPKINYEGNGNQRANLPSEVNKPVRPATPIKSKAKTTPVATAKITQPQIKEERPSGTLRDGLATNKIKTTMGIETDGYGVNQSGFAGPSSTNNVLAVNSPNNKSQNDGAMFQASFPSEQAKPLRSVEPTNLPARNYGAFDNDTYQEKAKSSKDSIIPTVSDKYRNDEVSYNQAYWAARKEGGATPSELKAEMDAIGMKKAYSGDRVITQDMKRQASDDLSRLTGSIATIQNGGVTKTDGDAYGLFGERQDTTYDYKGGPSVVTRSNDPSLFGVNFGDKTSTTFVNGVEVATKTGRDPLGRDAKVTRPDGLAKGINDRVEASSDPIKEISDIDNQIKTETDPARLKALHKRRLMLMRMNRTNTRFAGLLGEADTKRTNLMSIS